MKFRSKRYKTAAAQATQQKVSLPEAVAKIKGWASTKFDQSLEIVLHLGLDSRQAEQSVRGAISLPHGIGRTQRVIAFCDGADAEQAKAAGAVEAGLEDLVKKVQGGWLDFDVAVAHPRAMGQVGKLGRVLGPQGKMPSPKSGTVTPDIVQAVREYTAGKVEFRNDSGGNVHAVVGKLSFDADKLVDNVTTFIENIRRMKPSSVKGTYIQKVCLSATMSPGVILDIV